MEAIVPRMKQSIVHVALVVRDYDEAIEFYTKKLNFRLVEDTYQPEQDKRWVVVAPPGPEGTSLLLARASKPEQEPFVGHQSGGRVFLFLNTDDFWRDYNRMVALGITFVREPKTESYGTVAVFKDLYGNLWDLLELKAGRVPRSAGRDGMASIRTVLKSQYHAALAMLRQAIEECPDDLWLGSQHRNAYWQIAYHALFFAHFYLMPEEAAFRPWKGHQGDVQNPDGLAPEDEDVSSSLPLIPTPYARAEVLAYWRICDDMVDDAVDALDLESPNSGFGWYHMSKLEHQLVNLRHIQHHAGQLADRLRAATDTGIRWVGGRP